MYPVKVNGIQIRTVENPIPVETIHTEPQKLEKKQRDMLHLLKGIKGINPILPKKELLVLHGKNLINQLEEVHHPLEVQIDLAHLEVHLTEVVQEGALQKAVLKEEETKRFYIIIKLFS